jgi:hypothetical protein
MAIFWGLVMPLLLGMAALVMDLGQLYVYKAEVQNAMDACALAAATQLTQTSDARLFDVARAHALALTDVTREGGAVRPATSVNRLHFQRDDFELGQIEVTFSHQIDGPFVAATSLATQGLAPTQARFARCRYADSNQPLWFAPILSRWGGASHTVGSVTAQAVAMLAPAQQVCAVPVTVCAAAGSSATNQYGLTLGQRLTAVNDPKAGYANGSFGWVDFTPPSGGASELNQLLEGSGVCQVATGTNIGQPGQISAAQGSWNTRFGIYRGSTQPTSAAPDFTGWGYATGGSHYADYVLQRSQRAAFQGGVSGGTTRLTSTQHAQWGQQRRIATAPIVQCSNWNSGNTGRTLPILDFACVLLLAPVTVGATPTGAGVAATMDLEFLGVANSSGSPCSSNGLLGGTGGPLVPGLVQ